MPDSVLPTGFIPVALAHPLPRDATSFETSLLFGLNALWQVAQAASVFFVALAAGGAAADGAAVSVGAAEATAAELGLPASADSTAFEALAGGGATSGGFSPTAPPPQAPNGKGARQPATKRRESE